MFAYCLNAPVNFSDFSGTASKAALAPEMFIERSPFKDVTTGGKVITYVL